MMNNFFTQSIREDTGTLIVQMMFGVLLLSFALLPAIAQAQEDTGEKQKTGRVIGFEKSSNRMLINLGADDGVTSESVFALYRDHKLNMLAAYAGVHTVHENSCVVVVRKQITDAELVVGEWAVLMYQNASSFFVGEQQDDFRSVLGQVMSVNNEANEFKINLGKQHGITDESDVQVFGDRSFSTQVKGVGKLNVTSVQESSSTIEFRILSSLTVESHPIEAGALVRVSMDKKWGDFGAFEESSDDKKDGRTLEELEGASEKKDKKSNDESSEN